jgi:hypothetical protein
MVAVPGARATTAPRPVIATMASSLDVVLVYARPLDVNPSSVSTSAMSVALSPTRTLATACNA